MRRALMCATLLAIAACGGGAGGTAQTSTTTRVRGSADVILENEINSAAYQNALEIVQILRPNMTVTRGVSSDGMRATTIPIVVYMDDVRLGDVQSLVNIPSNRVKEIRFLNARDATTRYGTGHSSGVILVTTKR